MSEKYSEKLITACLEYQKDAEIAKAVGISPQTLCKYKKDPEFVKLVDERRAEYVKAAVYKMQSSLMRTVDEVMAIIENQETAAQVKLNACQLILTNCARWTEEIDIMQRVKALEDKANE